MTNIFARAGDKNSQHYQILVIYAEDHVRLRWTEMLGTIMQASLALIRTIKLLHFRECFNSSKECDGHLDCSDSTDEMDCPPGTPSPPSVSTMAKPASSPTSTRATAVTKATLSPTTFNTTTPAVTTTLGRNSSKYPHPLTKLPPEVSTESPPPPVGHKWPPIWWICILVIQQIIITGIVISFWVTSCRGGGGSGGGGGCGSGGGGGGRRRIAISIPFFLLVPVVLFPPLTVIPSLYPSPSNPSNPDQTKPSNPPTLKPTTPPEGCEKAKPVDGQWTEWSAWQDAGAQSIRVRYCNSPKPRDGGRFTL